MQNQKNKSETSSKKNILTPNVESQTDKFSDLGDTWDDCGEIITQNLQTNPNVFYIPREILMTDRGNVLRLLNRERENIIFIKGLGFCVWNGRYWETEADALLQEKILETHAEIIQEISHQPDKASRKKMAAWVEQSNNQARINAVVRLLEKESSIQKDVEILDQNDWLISFQNGTLNLKTQEFKDFDPLDYISKILPYDFDPEAECPQWETFLSQILPDKKEVDWIQRVVGYSLTGDTSGQFFMFCFGAGGNGKGILLQTLMELMGPYSCSLPSESFMVKMNDGGVPNDIAGIRGSRLVVASEVPSGKKWNEALLKQLTGSDPVKARFLRKEYFTFKPKCKIWISGNPRPAVSDSGNAFWRRLKLVEFKQSFDKKPDRYLAARLRKELPGIFMWAFYGLVDALEDERGIAQALTPPDSITQETEAYRMENDTVSRFISEKCVVDKSRSGIMELPSGKAFTAYYDWCKEQGEVSNMLNSKEFPKKMEILGFKKRKGEKFNYFMHLKLDDEAPASSSILEDVSPTFPEKEIPDMTDQEFDPVQWKMFP